MSDATTGLGTARVPLLNEEGIFPDRFAPQIVTDTATELTRTTFARPSLDGKTLSIVDRGAASFDDAKPHELTITMEDDLVEYLVPKLDDISRKMSESVMPYRLIACRVINDTQNGVKAWRILGKTADNLNNSLNVDSVEVSADGRYLILHFESVGVKKIHTAQISQNEGMLNEGITPATAMSLGSARISFQQDKSLRASINYSSGWQSSNSAITSMIFASPGVLTCGFSPTYFSTRAVAADLSLTGYGSVRPAMNDLGPAITNESVSMKFYNGDGTLRATVSTAMRVNMTLTAFGTVYAADMIAASAPAIAFNFLAIVEV